MATFEKREKEKRRQQKQNEKKARKEERKAKSPGGALEDMMAYVDENGRLTSTPPDPSKRKPIDASTIEISVPRRPDVEEDATHRGRIDFFDTTKGFGFIREDGTPERYFVHVSGLLDTVTANDAVTFELERGPRGMNAVRVKKA